MSTRKAERTIYTSTWSQATVTVMSDPAPERSLSAVELVIAPGGMSSRRPEARAYDTFATVLAGMLTLITEDRAIALEPGDSAYLPANTTFAWANQQETPGTLLLVGVSGRVGPGQGVFTFSAGAKRHGDENL